MTTKHSSSRPCSPQKLAQSDGQPVQLGDEIGSGGEGGVFAVTGQPEVVAKVYHRLPLSSDEAAKLEAVVACRSPELATISAWPQSVLYDARRKQPCGILMPRVIESRQLHELYGTYNRRMHFPEVKWHHLLLAARNVAAAFHSLHSAGIVVGDVNQGNLMVDHRMCVRFIDCDSFQVSGKNGQVFTCPVGTPHFTPRELQLVKLREVVRTPNHDSFGMAILIFHLLFVGRHPFAGRYRAADELTIEMAIAEGRFAFSAHKDETLVDPPPASLLLSDLPPDVADLFEWTFRGRNGSDERPTAKQWADALESLLKRRKVCSFDASHVYYDQLKSCPWCRIEDEGGPPFFVAGEAASLAAKNRMGALDLRIKELRAPKFPDLPAGRLVLPGVLAPEKPAAAPPRSRSDMAAMVMVASAVLCLLGAVNLVSLAAGTACALVGGGLLLFGKEARARRKQVAEFHQRLGQIQGKLVQWSRSILGQHRQREAQFNSSLGEVRIERDHYYAKGPQLRNVLVMQRGSQKDRFLAEHLIQDDMRRIPGLTEPMLSMLESFGVESALDIDSLKLIGVPMLTPSLTMELMNWRQRLETEFNYRPEHGITFSDLKDSEEAAVARFRVWQARRVLMAAKQLESLAESASYELERALGKFDELGAQGRDVVIKLRDYQTGRRRLERWLNQSATRILTVALAVPFVGLLLYLAFG